MSSNSDDIQAAGSDTRPPMLDRTDYESWSQRIRLYCRGKENGLQILQSIDQGPFELGTTRDTLGTTPEGGVLLGPERPRTYEDLGFPPQKVVLLVMGNLFMRVLHGAQPRRGAIWLDFIYCGHLSATKHATSLLEQGLKGQDIQIPSEENPNPFITNFDQQKRD
ncbi:hypothetical protein Tco_0988274 [Tanacetum coccineum]|uniref:Integrase, catalytic region, zinc finger, CCHC-type, peptidase aspartic, catalytic n=1 Tax=Tanacetum coccineum TaxID=301880 RepID=A0ABQ5ERE1_9ASTR